MEHFHGYEMSEEEKTWFETYDINGFDRPSVATDMAVFSIMGMDSVNGGRTNHRKDPEKRLKLLLIRRASYPYRD